MNTDIMQSYPHIIFYDYTKIARQFLFKLPANYSLTFSLSESNLADAKLVLANGGNIAAVFRKDIPMQWLGHNVISGDKNDLRFTDPKNVVVALKAKGKAKKDTSGFVIDYTSQSA
jgi:hypothetical protein